MPLASCFHQVGDVCQTINFETFDLKSLFLVDLCGYIVHLKVKIIGQGHCRKKRKTWCHFWLKVRRIVFACAQRMFAEYGILCEM